MNKPLNDCRVLELTLGDLGLAGKLLADMGAEIIRIVPPGYRPDAESAYLDSAKALIVLDIDDPGSRDMLADFIAGSDVFIESLGPDALEKLELGSGQVSRDNPGIIHVTITGFGPEGPYAHYRSSDMVQQAMGGWLSVTGEPDCPLGLPGGQAYHNAALFAVNGILLALRRHRHTGRGEHIDISVQECAASVLDHVLVRYAAGGEIAQRQGSLHWNTMFRVFPCRNGHILLSIQRQWDTLVEWMYSEGMAGDLRGEQWNDESYRRTNIDHIIEVLEAWTMSHTVEELVETGQLMRYPWTRVESLDEVLADVHLDERRFFREIVYNDNKYKVPGPPWRPGENSA